MKRVLFAILIVALVACGKDDMGEYYPTIGSRELHYISRSGEKVLFDDNDFDAPLISNTYVKDKGIVTFASPLKKIYFLGSLDLSSITIPTSVAEFECNPFKSCKNLARFISKYSASNGYALVKDDSLIALARNYMEENYEIPYGVTTIGNSALFGARIKSVSIPNSVAKIEDYAFECCDELEKLILPERLQSLGIGTCLNCLSLREVSIPETLSFVGAYGYFMGCESLEKFSGAYVSSDGRCVVQDKSLYAFAPKDMTAYSIPEGVEVIASRAFAECNRLKSLTLPRSIVSLGDAVFDNCSRLEEINIETTTPPTIIGGSANVDLFANLPSDYVIYVPMSSVAKYKGNNDWARYEEHIVGKNF